MNLANMQNMAQRIKKNIQQVIVGKDETINFLLVALLSSGHVLLEDVPGTGKTLLAKALSKSLDCRFKRIQFTPDLLPSDITGFNFYNQQKGEFVFHPGPVFAHILLADEINRATPRTQSSLLECMQERQVTIDGMSRNLERPFMVIATQNPVESQGTFPLPEAQLDRFLLQVDMGYPTKEEGMTILKRFKADNPLDKIEAVASLEDIVQAQSIYSSVHVHDDLLNYMLELVEQTRSHPHIELGISPRGSQALLMAVQVYAVLRGRDYVLPDDIKMLLKPVCGHRLILSQTAQVKDNQVEAILNQVLEAVTVPTEEQLTKGLVN